MKYSIYLVLSVVLSFLLSGEPSKSTNDYAQNSMTISSTDRVAGPFTTNGATVDYPFTFKVFSDADLRVVKVTTPNNTIADLALTSDYTVTLNSNQNTSPGGTVTISPALASGFEITVTSDIDELQPVSLSNQGGFFPSVISDALDRITILVQQLSSKIARSLEFPLGDNTAADLPSIASRSGNVLAFDDSGVPVAGPASNDVSVIAGSISAITNVENALPAINNVDSISAAIVGVNNNELNIQDVLDNLGDIQTVAGTLTMTRAELTLVLDNNTSVEGVNYNSLKDCIEYAESVLQVGGTLNISVAIDTMVEPSGQVVIDGNRMTVNIIGLSPTGSIIDIAAATNIQILGGNGTGHSFRTFTLNGHANASLSAMHIYNAPNVEINNVRINSSENAVYLETSHVRITNSIITAKTFSVTVGSFGKLILSASTLDTTDTAGDTTCLLVSNVGAVLVTNSDFTSAITSGTSYGIRAPSGGTVSAPGLSATFGPNIDVDTDPVVDTYGNFYSRIITAY